VEEKKPKSQDMMVALGAILEVNPWSEHIDIKLFQAQNALM
jgi:hypothetical protein